MLLKLLQDVLRRAWDFQGFVVSDAFSVGSLVTHGFARDPEDAAFRAFTAGVNMDMASSTYLKHLPELAKQGRITEAQVDSLVRPILEMKIRLGLFEHPYVDEVRAAELLKSPGDVQLARRAAERTMVLLRNDDQLLPLKKSVRSVAVIGPLADSAHDTNGSWLVFGNKAKEAVTVLEGIRNKLGSGVKIEYSAGPEIRRWIPSFIDTLEGRKPNPAQTKEESQKAFDDAIAAIRKCDVTVAVLGELGNMSGEAASRASRAILTAR